MGKSGLKLQNLIKPFAIILSSIYLTFLVDIYTLNTVLKRIFVLGYFLAACSLCLFLKEKYWTKSHLRRQSISSVLLAGFISLGVLLSFQNVFLPSVIPTQVTLIADGTGEVWLVEAEIDGQNIPLSNLEIDENSGWEYSPEYDDYVFYPSAEYDENALSFDLTKSNIILKFATNPWSGGVLITHSDGVSEYIDLLSSKNEDKRIDYLITGKKTYSFYEKIILNIGAYSVIAFFLQIIFSQVIKNFTHIKVDWVANRITKIFKSKKSKGYSIFLCTFVIVWRLIFMSTLNPYVMYSDSWSYIEYPWTDFLHLHFTSGRTPIYPAFLFGMRMVFGESRYLMIVPYIQMLTSIISLFFLYRALFLITRNGKISNLLTTLYGVNPDVIVWDSSILTESIALSLTVFFLYVLVTYIDKPSRKVGMHAVLLTLVMIFFRPTFLLFGALLFGFWLIRWFTNKEERKILIQLAAASICTFLIVAGYSYNFMNTFGIFSISDAMPRQNTVTAIVQGHYLTSSDSEYISTITESLKTNDGDIWETCGEVLNKFGLPKADSLAKESFYSDKNNYIKSLISKILNDTRYEFSTYYINFSSKFDRSAFQFGSATDEPLLTWITYLLSTFLMPLLQIKMGYLYFTIINEATIFLLVLYKYKKIDWIRLGIFTFMSLIVCSTYVATCGEYARTMIHILPFFYIGVANFISILTLEGTLHLKGVADENL